MAKHKIIIDEMRVIKYIKDEGSLVFLSRSLEPNGELRWLRKSSPPPSVPVCRSTACGLVRRPV